MNVANPLSSNDEPGQCPLAGHPLPPPYSAEDPTVRVALRHAREQSNVLSEDYVPGVPGVPGVQIPPPPYEKEEPSEPQSEQQSELPVAVVPAVVVHEPRGGCRCCRIRTETITVTVVKILISLVLILAFATVHSTNESNKEGDNTIGALLVSAIVLYCIITGACAFCFLGIIQKRDDLLKIGIIVSAATHILGTVIIVSYFILYGFYIKFSFHIAYDIYFHVVLQKYQRYLKSVKNNSVSTSAVP